MWTLLCLTELHPPFISQTLRDGKPQVQMSITHPTLRRHIFWATESAQGLGSSVGIVTRYEPEGPGIESRWWRDFSHPSTPALGLTQSPIRWVPGLFPRSKAAEAWRWPPTPSSAEVKERVKLYLYSTSGLVSCYRVNFTFLPLPLLYDSFYDTLSHCSEQLW